MAITKYPNQYYYQSRAPLDASTQVTSFSDLSDIEKVAPFVGKMVHVKDDHKVYICSKIEGTTEWQPLFNDAGTEFYLKVTSDDPTENRFATLRIKPDTTDPSILRLDIDWPQT